MMLESLVEEGHLVIHLAREDGRHFQSFFCIFLLNHSKMPRPSKELTLKPSLFATLVS